MHLRQSPAEIVAAWGGMWDATGHPLNRMNNAHREARVLAEQLRKSFPKKTRTQIEIRAVAGTEGRETATRLQTSLSLGGLDATIVEVGSSPRDEILIESSHQTAGVALALQTAFLNAGIGVQLLVQNKANPKRIVLHLGMSGS